MKNPKFLFFAFVLYLGAFCLGARFDQWGIVFAIPFAITGVYTIWQGGLKEIVGLINHKRFIIGFSVFISLAWALVALFFWLTNTWGFDTLSFTQAVAHFAIDGSYYNQSLNMPAVCDHFTAALLLFSPLFVWIKTSLWFVGIRVVCYALSIWVLYLIATHFELSSLSKNVVVFIYLIYYPTSVLLSYDFQPSNLALLIFPLAFLWWIKQKYISSISTLAISLFFKENMGLLFCLLGVYVCLFEHKWKTGILLGLIGVASCYMIFHYLTPWVSGCDNFHSNYISPFSHLPLKGEMLLNLLLGVGFLPLIDWRCLLLILASLGLSFISGMKEMAGIGYHYHDIPTATIFICLVLVLKDKEVEHFKAGVLKEKVLVSFSFICIVLYNKYPPSADLWKHFPTVEDVKIWKASTRLEASLDPKDELWVQNSLAHRFLTIKNLNSIQFLQSIPSTNHLLLNKRLHYVILANGANTWPLEETFPVFVNQLDQGVEMGLYEKQVGFEPLLVYKRIK